MPYHINRHGEVVRTESGRNTSPSTPPAPPPTRFRPAQRPFFVALLALVCGLISMVHFMGAYNASSVFLGVRGVFFFLLMIGLWSLRSWARWLTLLSAAATVLYFYGGVREFWVSAFALILPLADASVNLAVAGLTVPYLLFSRAFR